MDVAVVDPRDVRWEVDDPEYRVTFWSSDGATSWEYMLTGAEGVRTVLEWVDRQTQAGNQHAGHVAEVLVVVERDDDGLGVLRLEGGRPRTAS